MRKLIHSMMTSLDGFIVDSHGSFDALTPPEAVHRHANEATDSVDAILFGRVLYEMFLAWDSLDLTDPAISDVEKEFARIFREKPRIVFSRTLQRVDGDAVLIKENIAEEVSRLKAQPGRDLALACGPELLATFVDLGLIDEFHLYVFPVVFGSGKALFGDLREKLALRLLDTKVIDSGVVFSRYEAASAAPS